MNPFRHPTIHLSIHISNPTQNISCHQHTYIHHFCIFTQFSGLKNNTGSLVFTSASGCKASENFDISSEN